MADATITINVKNLTAQEFAKVQKDLAGLGGEAEKTTQKTGGLAGSVKGFFTAHASVFKAVAAGAAIVGGAIAAVALAVGKLALRGSELVGVEDSFQRLTAAAGETGDVMLRNTSTAAKGLISDLDIMKAANKGLLLGLPITSSSMGDLAKTAIVLGRAMGAGAGKSLDDLLTSLGRSSPLILDNLGLTVKVGEANETYARKVGLAVGQLTEADKKTAFYEAALAAAKIKVDELGGIHLTLGDRIRVAQIWMVNLTDGLSMAIARSPVLGAAFESVGAMLGQAFGGGQQGLILAITRGLERSAITVLALGQATLDVAGIMHQGLSGIKAVVFTVATGFVTLADMVNRATLSILEVAAAVPGVGGAFQGAATNARGLVDESSSLKFNLEQLTLEAIDGAKGQGEFADKLNVAKGALETIQGAMVNAGLTTATTTTQTQGLTKAVQDETQSMAEASEAAKKLAEKIFAIETGAQPATDKVLGLGEAILGMGLIVDTGVKQWVSNFEFARDKFATVQQEMTLANLTGIALRLAEIEIAQAKELAGLEVLKLTHQTQFEELTALVKKKYQQMADAATGAHLTIEGRAKAAGFTSRAEMEATRDKALATFEEMKNSGLFTADEIQRAWEASEKARREAMGDTGTAWGEQKDLLLSGTASLLGELGRKYKAAAIAGAIIATYQAIAKALASAPWPFNLILVAGAAAAGWANVNRIRSSEAGFRHGTPDLDFQNFGPRQMTTLHGEEAVIPRGSGHRLAGEIAAALKPMLGARGGRGGPQSIVIPISVGGRELDRVIVDVSQRAHTEGRIRVRRDALVQR